MFGIQHRPGPLMNCIWIRCVNSFNNAASESQRGARHWAAAWWQTQVEIPEPHCKDTYTGKAGRKRLITVLW